MVSPGLVLIERERLPVRGRHRASAVDLRRLRAARRPRPPSCVPARSRGRACCNRSPLAMTVRRRVAPRALVLVPAPRLRGLLLLSGSAASPCAQPLCASSRRRVRACDARSPRYEGAPSRSAVPRLEPSCSQPPSRARFSRAQRSRRSLAGHPRVCPLAPVTFLLCPLSSRRGGAPPPSCGSQGPRARGRSRPCGEVFWLTVAFRVCGLSSPPSAPLSRSQEHRRSLAARALCAGHPCVCPLAPASVPTVSHLASPRRYAVALVFIPSPCAHGRLSLLSVSPCSHAQRHRCSVVAPSCAGHPHALSAALSLARALLWPRCLSVASPLRLFSWLAVGSIGNTPSVGW